MDLRMSFSKVTVVFLLVALCSPSPPQPDEDTIITQAETKLRIDGNLADWGPHREFPILLSPEGEMIEPSTDIAVSARFAFDASRFYCAVLAKDDFFDFPSRSWRFGDGFYLTFIDPHSGGESARFSTFGFSLEDKQAVKVLVNKDGIYYPASSTEDIQCVITHDEKKKVIIYEIAIPFKILTPFKPFIHDRWAVNLIYVDGDGGTGERRILQLYPDSNYDTELTKLRKGRIFKFQSRLPSAPEFQSAINASFFDRSDEKILTCAVNSPSESFGWTVRFEVSSAFDNVSSIFEIDLQPGMNMFSFPIEHGANGTGVYIISAGVIDAKNSLRFREDHQFFLMGEEDIARWSAEIAEAMESELFAKNTGYRESLPSLEIRLDWIKTFMEEAPPFADIRDLIQWTEDLDSFVQKIKSGSPGLFPPGQISRLAHRSNIDGSLQPYSLYVPYFYDDKFPLPLIVSLHGSGVDELDTIRYVSGQAAQRGRFLVLAPKARGLSDWYIGSSGEDVLECIDHVKKLFPVDEKNVILDGFSMGGYGAWRLSCLHPERFRAVIIRSGAVSTPPGVNGENILDLLDRKTGLPYFIVHGDRDNSVSVDNARMVAARLKELGARFEYVEVPGAAHGGYDRWKEIFDWLRRVMQN